MKIVQVLDYYASGNAVANCAVTYHKFSERLGFESKIVARLIDKRDDYIEELSYLDFLSEKDVIMYHLCIGTPLNEDICDYECKKVLVYHNITPPVFLEKYNKGLADACEEGLKQLVMMKSYFQLCLADSEFNRQDLIKAGYDADKITVIPPFVSRKDFQNTPDAKTVELYNDGWTNILFVGRVSPHKKYEDLIKIFNYYKKNVNPNSRLILAGGVMENYHQLLMDYVKELELEDVIFTKQISFATLLAFYKTASVFLCASEHEGYCIPLIEAMIFHIPVIGFQAGAVGDTMGGSGVLLDDKSPILVSRIINELECNQELRENVLKRQDEYLETLTEERLFERYKNWIENINSLNDYSVWQEQVVQIESDCSPYDVVMVIKASDWNTAKINLNYIRKNLRPKRIVVISSKKIREYLQPEDNVVFINEDRLYSGMTFQKVKEFFVDRGLEVSLTGWFLQQFLKLAYAFICKDEFYLTWDADTLPLNPISMIDLDTGRPCFDMKPEYIKPYFDTLNKLLGLEKVEEESFIAEHMLFNVKIVKDMINRIEQNDSISGDKFFEKILYASDFSKQGNVFSEFETYGTFCRYYYPDLYEKRHINSFRGGKMFLGEAPSDAVLNWVAKDKDIVSFEYPQPVITDAEVLSKDKKIRSKYTFNEFIECIYRADVLKQSEWLKAEEAVLLMDYPWAKEPIYRHANQKKEILERKDNNSFKKFLIFKPNTELCALGVILRGNSFDVAIYDPEENMQKTVDANNPIGMKAFQKSNIWDEFEVLGELTKKREFFGAFISKDNFDEYIKLSQKAGLSVQNCIIVGNGFTQENYQNIENVKLLIETSFVGKNALLNNMRTRLYAYSFDFAFSKQFGEWFSKEIKMKIISDYNEFIDFSEKAHRFKEGVFELKKQILSENKQLNWFFENMGIY